MTRQQKIALSLLGFLLLAGELFGRDRSGSAPAGGLEILSYLGRSDLPRGMRNNNPGNIKIGASPWQGKIPVPANTDGVFEQFETYVYGVRAMIKLLRDTYMNQWRLRTLRQIIARYAPSTENNTEGYLAAVSRRTGFAADVPLAPDKETLRALVKAMAYHENGREAVDDVLFNYAWSLL